MSELEIAINVSVLTSIVGCLTFVAYNHPRQYSWFTAVLAVLVVMLIAFNWEFDKVEATMVYRINHSWLTTEQKADVVKIIKAPPTLTATENFWCDALNPLIIYASLLSFLPLLGLTADARERTRRREF